MKTMFMPLLVCIISLLLYYSIYILYKLKIHYSCEIEYLVETHLCKLCVIYDEARNRIHAKKRGNGGNDISSK